MLSPKTLRKWLLLEKKEKENETSPPYLASPSTWSLLSKEANLFSHWSPNLHIHLENLQMLIPIFFQDPNNSLLSPWPWLFSCLGKAENHFFSPNSHLFFPPQTYRKLKVHYKEILSWTMRKLLTQGLSPANILVFPKNKDIHLQNHKAIIPIRKQTLIHYHHLILWLNSVFFQVSKPCP